MTLGLVAIVSLGLVTVSSATVCFLAQAETQNIENSEDADSYADQPLTSEQIQTYFENTYMNQDKPSVENRAGMGVSEQEWLSTNSDVAPFIGEWQGSLESEQVISMSIYPSYRVQDVCVLVRTNNDIIVGYNEASVEPITYEHDGGNLPNEASDVDRDNLSLPLRQLRVRTELFTDQSLPTDLIFEFISSDSLIRYDDYLIWGFYDDFSGIPQFFPMSFNDSLKLPSEVLGESEFTDIIMRSFYAAGCRLSPDEEVSVVLPEKPSNISLSASQAVDGVTVRFDDGYMLSDRVFEAHLIIENESNQAFIIQSRSFVVQDNNGQRFIARYRSDVRGNTVQPGGVMTATVWVDHPWSTAQQNRLNLTITEGSSGGRSLQIPFE